MVASIKPHRDEIGLTDGELLIDGSWGPSRPSRSGRTATRPPARMSPRSRLPDRRTWTGPSGPRAGRSTRVPGRGSRAQERIRVLHRIADLVREHGDELLALQALDNSVPLSFGAVYGMSAAFVADVFDHHAGWVDKLAGETLPAYQGGDHLVMTLREPVGVGGAIVPWNAPLLLTAQKLAPGARGRLHGRAEAVGVRDVLGAAAGPPDRGGRAARGRTQRRHRPGRPDRRRAHPPPDGRQDLVHRQPDRGPEDHRGIGGHIQAGQPGARRQEPGAGLRGRRRGHRGRDDHGHGHPRLVRPGLPGADQGAGAPGEGRRVPRRWPR